jgi:hypothetical protein
VVERLRAAERLVQLFSATRDLPLHRGDLVADALDRVNRTVIERTSSS